MLHWAWKIACWIRIIQLICEMIMVLLSSKLIMAIIAKTSDDITVLTSLASNHNRCELETLGILTHYNLIYFNWNVVLLCRFVLDTCRRLKENKSYILYTTVGCFGVSALSDLVKEVMSFYSPKKHCLICIISKIDLFCSWN